MFDPNGVKIELNYANAEAEGLRAEIKASELAGLDREGKMIRYFAWFLLAIASNGTALAQTLPAIAQAFPSKPVRLIVTYAPGGSSDLMARVLGQKADRALGPAGGRRRQARRGWLHRHGIRGAPALPTATPSSSAISSRWR
jgi:hypothetical protein